MVPFAALAPFTVAELLEQIVWEPPAIAVGEGFTKTVIGNIGLEQPFNVDVPKTL